MAELRMIAARYDEYDAAYFQANVLEPIEKLLRQPSLHLRDIINEVDVEPADIGVGVSQVIPVVVGAIASTADAGRCSIFAVEQPELHVHPRIQCNLGDVFAGEAGKSDGRVFLIETHSEHLILRLLRRIRETTENELPPGKPALTPEQVAVYFVEGGPDGMKVTEIPVAPDGDFTKQWPQGFFPERVEELM
jgi:predicted ATPase